jgi:hypothetical protein
MGGSFGCHPYLFGGSSTVWREFEEGWFPKWESWVASHFGHSSLGSNYTDFVDF